MSASVVIIGAGLAGLTCARELNRRGFDVSVIEASDGVGGRVRSDYVDGYILDHGFQVLFDAYPAAQRQLDLPLLDLHPFDPGAIIATTGKQTILTDPLRDRNLNALVNAGLSNAALPTDKIRTLQLVLELRSHTIDQILEGEDTSTLTYLRQRGFSEHVINTFFRPFYGGIFLDRSLQTSAKCFKFDFKMLSEGATTLPARGMGQISQQLAQPLLAHNRIRFNAAAEALIVEDEQVVGVRLTQGEAIRTDIVVVATPAPETARLTDLPMPQNELQTVTLYFSGDAPVYQGKKIVLNPRTDAFVNNAQLLTNVAPTYAPDGKHLLSTTVLGNPALDDTALFRRTLTDLHRMFESDRKAQAALAQYQPLRLYRIPFAQFQQPPGLHPTLPDNRTIRPGLYIAGELTEASSLNAAMISGEKCAECIAEDIQTKAISA
ncbi:MAG: FAD-dependent oxidoreductase [Chloroflexi bacterium AL-W]|nr:FAD-dependent oxidoreductase [Blastochloris sp.]NOK63656.1 FAD-dependent oxidoreductase [Chloroflexi bacterium AL-N1]NOK68528.1 FAD-dependent oxidoreductase [Chloroflexi bacterium AL-N10]NOK76014.1 FAD-dependent oxidoreductase [Chloroflexi bacterium AL-N5]NOK82485.1 FAD-dependent oxidoreductase [Chloroflexi bacterium AL-W]NOK92797.1 FAD-dependent oxidoreductase [Chloroflexi bacterium AL-N15]